MSKALLKTQVSTGQRFVSAVLTLALAVTPLGLITRGFVSHDVIPKFFLLLTSAACLLFGMRYWAPGVRSLWTTRSGRVFICLAAAQFLSLLLSTAFSVQPRLSIAGTTWRRFGLLGQTAVLVIALALAGAAYLHRISIPRITHAVTVCGALAAVYGICQYFGADPFLERRLYAIGYFGGIARPPATMGHALYFSAYLVPVVFLSWTGARAEKQNSWKRALVVSGFLGCVAIVLSATRSAMLAVFIGGCFLILRSGVTFRGLATRRRMFLAALVLTGAAVFMLSPASSNLRSRISQWRQEGGGPRFQMWRETYALIALHPLLGSGPETFGGAFREIESADLSRAFPDFLQETPHNAFIDAACSQGSVGLMILIALVVTALCCPRTVDQFPLGQQAALLGLTVSSMFASLTLVSSLYLWALAGLIVASDETDRLVGAERDATAPAPIPGAILGAVMMMAAALFTLQDSAWEGLAHAVSEKNSVAATEALDKARALGMGLPGYELWASRQFAILGNALGRTSEGLIAWAHARDAASFAEHTGEERFSAAYQSAVLALASADLTRAEAEARTAVALAPHWYRGHLLLSQILGFTGRNEEAARESALSEWLGWKTGPHPQ